MNSRRTNKTNSKGIIETKTLILILSLLFTLFPSCVDKPIIKKDKKDKQHIENKTKDPLKQDDKENKKVHQDKNQHTDTTDKDDTQTTDTQDTQNTQDTQDTQTEEKPFDLTQELTHETLEGFAKAFAKMETLDESLQETYFQTIQLLDHTNKYEELTSILFLLKDIQDIPENIKTINNNYTTGYEATKIGLIIPKKSIYKKLAKDIENGIKLAQQRYRGNLEIIIKETNASMEETDKAIQELIFEDKVMLIIGTLKSSNAQRVSMVAEKYHVPFISLSKSNELLKHNKYTFNYYVNIKYSAEFIAKYAIKELKLKTFAILYPNSKYGTKNMVSFWKAVEANGGKITSVRSYSATRKDDYIAPAKKLVGRYYLNARDDYTLEKRKLRKLKSGYTLKKALETLEKDLEPQIDFEAIFIPDGAESTTILLPYLALYDINFKTRNKWQNFLAAQKAKDKKYKLKFVQLLGTQTWAKDSIAEGASKYIQGSRFPVTYNARVNNKDVSKFTSRYIKAYNRRPSAHSLYAFEVFDIVNKVLQKLEGDQLRKNFVETLLLKNFKTITGEVKFNQYGEAIKHLFIMKFTSEKYKSVD